MLRITLLSLLMLITSGCAFFGGGVIGEAIYTSPSQEFPHITYMLKSDFTKMEPGVNRTVYIKLSDIVAEWGKPSEVLYNNGIKSITYEKGLRWKGLRLMLIVPYPIPIAVPVGHKTVTFHLKDDTLINWTIHDSHYCESYIGFNFMPYIPFGFEAETQCEGHKDMSRYEGQMACDVLFYDKCYPKNKPSGMRE